jgi:hypothetical protein
LLLCALSASASAAVCGHGLEFGSAEAACAHDCANYGGVKSAAIGEI